MTAPALKKKPRSAERTRLKSFAFNGTMIGDGLVELSKLRSIQTLNLPSLDLQGQNVASLGKLATLEYLRLNDSSLNDRQITQFATMHSLKGLDISNTEVSRIGLTALRVLPQLDHINHRGSRMTDKDAQELANRYGWTFTGDCNCGCMDIAPQNPIRRAPPLTQR